MKNLFIKLLAFVAVFCYAMYATNANAAKLTLESKMELPKNMKGMKYSLLKYEDGDILAYESTYSGLTFVRFDKSFTIKQQFTAKKVPYKIAYINADGPQIDVVAYDDKKNVQHLAFDKNTLNLLKTEVLIEQQKYRSFAFKYTNVHVETSPNGKYIAVLALWDHVSVGLAFNSNHLYLYNDKFEKIGNWSLDEDLRCVSLGSSENAALWQQYYPDIKVNDDGTVVYVALSDYGSNIYSKEYGTGSSLKAHILSKEGDKVHDFGLVAKEKHLQAPCILSYDGSKLLLTSDIFTYAPAKVNNVKEFVYKLDGYCLLDCNLNDNTFVSEVGTYEPSYSSIIETSNWNSSFPNVQSSVKNGLLIPQNLDNFGYLFTYDDNNLGLVLMDTKGKNRKTFTLGYAYTQKNRGLVASASSHVHDLDMLQAIYMESNGTLCTTSKGNVFYWTTIGSVWESSWAKEKYETTISVNEFDVSGRTSTKAVVFQQKSKEPLSIQSVPLSDDKFLVLIDYCQWATLEL